jgi:hypothetical protein
MAGCVPWANTARVSESAIRRTHPSWLRRGRSNLPLLTVHGPWLGQVRGRRDDTL